MEQHRHTCSHGISEKAEVSAHSHEESQHMHESHDAAPHCSCHSHDHDHEHHHEHEHHPRSSQEAIQVTSHPPAVVGSVTLRIMDSYDASVAETERRMHTAADQILACGGFIGHIKGIVEADTCRCRISITDGEGTDKQWLTPQNTCRGDCVFIVFGLECEELHHILQQAFADLIP